MALTKFLLNYDISCHQLYSEFGTEEDIAIYLLTFVTRPAKTRHGGYVSTLVNISD